MLGFGETCGKHRTLFCSMLCACCIFISGTASAVGDGIVLCICHDGHIRLEIDCSKSFCCPEDKCANEQDSGLTAWLMTSPEPTHSCVDIPLIGSDAQVREEAAVIAAFNNTISHGSSGLPNFLVSPSHSPRESLPPPLAVHCRAAVLHRTSVLLI